MCWKFYRITMSCLCTFEPNINLYVKHVSIDNLVASQQRDDIGGPLKVPYKEAQEHIELR